MTGSVDLQTHSRALLRRGYSEAQVRGVLGENFSRVAAQVWK